MPFSAHVVILLRLLSLALFYRFEALLYPAVYFRQVSFQGRQFGFFALGTFHHFPQDGNIFLQFLVLFPEIFQCRLNGRERVGEVPRSQSRVGDDIPVVVLV